MVSRAMWSHRPAEIQERTRWKRVRREVREYVCLRATVALAGCPLLESINSLDCWLILVYEVIDGA